MYFECGNWVKLKSGKNYFVLPLKAIPLSTRQCNVIFPLALFTFLSTKFNQSRIHISYTWDHFVNTQHPPSECFFFSWHGYGLEGRRIRVLISTTARESVFVLHRVETDCWLHPGTYSLGTFGFFNGDKAWTSLYLMSILQIRGTISTLSHTSSRYAV
jgi:hypothetical protein